MASTHLPSFAIFCDDVRQEGNGKGIFIGTYRDQMFFAGPPPWHHPLLACHIVLRGLRNGPPPTLAIEIRVEDDQGTRVLARADISTDEPEAGARALPHEKNPPRLWQSVLTVALGPVQIDRPSKFLAYGIVNGEEQLLERVRMMQHPDTVKTDA